MKNEPLTEKEVRLIAREESAKMIKKEMDSIREELVKQGQILARLERVLLGEDGEEPDEALKWRANFAYQYARVNTENNLQERNQKMLAWFEDMNTLEPGCKETKIDSLGKLISLYSHIKWLLALLEITTLFNALPVLQIILKWIEQGVK